MAEFAAFRACEILVRLSIGFRRRVWLSAVIVPGEVEIFVRLLVDSWNILIHEWFKTDQILPWLLTLNFFCFSSALAKWGSKSWTVEVMEWARTNSPSMNLIHVYEYTFLAWNLKKCPLNTWKENYSILPVPAETSQVLCLTIECQQWTQLLERLAGEIVRLHRITNEVGLGEVYLCIRTSNSCFGNVHRVWELSFLSLKLRIRPSLRS